MESLSWIIDFPSKTIKSKSPSYPPKFYIMFIVFFIIIFSVVQVESELYTVGGDEWRSGNNYVEWSQQYNFSVGDVLVFNYVKGQHNVYEVTQDTYRSCDASTGVLEKYESGHDQVSLAEAKKYWFICNIAGHCLGGMKFGVDVNQGSVKNNTSSIAPNSDHHPSPHATNNDHVHGKGRICVLFVSFGILLLMNWS